MSDRNDPGTVHRNQRVKVEKAQFEELAPAESGNGGISLDLLLDVPLQVTVELGRARKLVRDILSLGPGAIVELDKLAGEPADVLVNGKLVARGEVVVIDENFGVRVTDVVSTADRVSALK